MSLLGILFNPQGRIEANQFWKGIIILVAFQIILQIVAILGISLGALGGLVSLAIIYPYLCVYGKRLHDSNKSAWMFLLFVFGHVVIIIISFFFVPGIGEFSNEYMELAQAGDTEAVEALAAQFTAEAQSAGAIIGLAGLLVSNLVLGFIVARMYSDPYENQYGLPEGGQIGDGNNNDDIFS